MARPKKEGVSEETKNLLAALEEKYGKGVVVKASEQEYTNVKETTPTGSLTLDLATKIGGIPKGGLITHILGKESSSKTTLSLHIIAEEQKKGNDCFFLDSEGTVDLAYAKRIGVDLDKLYILDEDALLRQLKIKDRTAVSGEEWLEMMVDLIKTNRFGIGVLDSVATLTPISELQKGIAGGGAIASIGSMLSKALRNINAHLTRTDMGLILLNQYRISPGAYGNPFVEVGGEALKYYTSLKIELSKSLDKDADGVYGIQVKAKITKSKVGNPYGEASYYVEFGKGIQRIEEVLDIAIDHDIIVQSGSWFSYGENKLGQGREAVKQLLLDNNDFYSEIEQMVIEKIKSNG
jgi:recombination protein RecA